MILWWRWIHFCIIMILEKVKVIKMKNMEPNTDIGNNEKKM